MNPLNFFTNFFRKYIPSTEEKQFVRDINGKFQNLRRCIISSKNLDHPTVSTGFEKDIVNLNTEITKSQVVNSIFGKKELDKYTNALDNLKKKIREKKTATSLGQ